MAELQRTTLVADASTAMDAGHFASTAGGHIVQFYDGEEFLAEAVTRFLGAGLIAGDRLVVIATPAHRKAFSDGLQAKGFDVERACAGGRLALLDARETLATFMSGNMPDWERFKAQMGPVVSGCGAAGAAQVRAYGEMVDLLWRDGNPQAAIRLEEYWNDLGLLHPFSLLCAYVMGNFYKEAHAAEFQKVCAAHSHVVPAEGYSAHDDEDKRLREISLLQQRARALETELQYRLELEEALRNARRESEAANQAKDEFLAMLGHELRNPLSPILTALELLKLRGDGRISREHQIIDRQTKHLIRLVDDLLDVSRITRGKVELRKQPVDLRDVLAKATEIASPLLEQRRHHFEVTAPPRGMKLLADEARLSQVVANLITNAAKYTDPGGHISVAARREGSQLIIEVSDNGMGIGPELLPRVFDLFVQGRQSADRAIGGLGIGLALVRNLVDLHGGEVEAFSAGPGMGSTFTVRLPALEQEEAGADAPPAGSFVRANVNRRRILVVDDNEDALEMLKEMLWNAGHDVRVATSGPSALEMVKEFRPEIAILDIGLPAMDGYELATRLRAALGVHTPRLMALSGYGQESDRARSQAAGFSLHLVKPLEATVLLDTIEGKLPAAKGKKGPPT
jgi:signal transduction histidine kinase/ActR/RegA family two-component response regulator